MFKNFLWSHNNNFLQFLGVTVVNKVFCSVAECC